MAKPTSLAAQIAKTHLEQKAKDDLEDRKAASSPVPAGKVMVRLVRACYDRNGVYHLPGVVAMYEDEIPSTAKRLSPPKDEADDDDEGTDD